MHIRILGIELLSLAKFLDRSRQIVFQFPRKSEVVP